MVLISLPFTDLRSAESRSDITADPSGMNTVDQGSCRPSILVRTTGAAGSLGVDRPGLADALPPGPVPLPEGLDAGELVLPAVGAPPPSPVHPARMSANATAAAAARPEGIRRKKPGGRPSATAEARALPWPDPVLLTLAVVTSYSAVVPLPVITVSLSAGSHSCSVPRPSSAPRPARCAESGSLGMRRGQEPHFGPGLRIAGAVFVVVGH